MKTVAIEKNKQVFTEADLSAALNSYVGPNGKLVLNEPKMFKASFDLFKAVCKRDVLSGASALPSMAALTASAINAYKSCQVSPPAQ